MRKLATIRNRGGYVTVENHVSGQLDTVEPGTEVIVFARGGCATLVVSVVAIATLLVTLL